MNASSVAGKFSGAWRTPEPRKTHLSVALAEAAIQSGFGAYFMTAHDLVSDLGRANAKAGWITACVSTWRRRC